MTQTDKLIAKHRVAFKLSADCTKLVKLATRERTWIEDSPDTSSRCIQLQKLEHDKHDTMHVLIAVAWGKCLSIDRQ